MLRAERLGYVSLMVEDIDVSTEFFTKAVHLEVSDRQDGKVYLRGGLQHHWIVLQETEKSGLAALGVEVADAATLKEYEDRLRDNDVEVESGEGLHSDFVVRYLKFRDPSGNPLEFYTDMFTMQAPPRPKAVEFLDIQHVVLAQRDFQEGLAFYTNVLGMRVSDYLEDGTVFTHFRNGWHHGIGLGVSRSKTHGLNHICFQPPDLDNTMRARAVVKQLGLPITADLMKHGPSGSIGFYFQGPDTVIEFSYGARKYGEEEDFKPRVLRRTGDSVDVWKMGLEDIELLSPEELHRRLQATS